MTHGTNFLATFARAFVALTALSLGLAIVGCGRGGTPDRDSASASVGGAASAGRAPASGAHFRTQKAPPEPALRYLTFQLGGAREEEELPLLIAVHGLGDTPQNFSRWLLSLDLKLRLVVPEAPDPYGHGYSWFPYREHRTEHELATGIAASRDRLERLLEQLERRFPT
ncbi:MAG: hypothetical protein KC766_26340, partial [Myxococcales bacterium]|nr:hypothetical protein [Myxococcales bacterium]